MLVKDRPNIIPDKFHDIWPIALEENIITYEGFCLFK